MKDYSMAKIYKIVCNVTGLVYIGSTCEPTLARRLAKHVGNYKLWIKDNTKNGYVTSYKVIENGNYGIFLIEDCPCERQDQLHVRERNYIESIECVNRYIPSRSPEEYRSINKDRISIRFKAYYEDNKEDLRAKKVNYYHENKDKLNKKITCFCGSIISYQHKASHEKTKLHQAYLKSQQTEILNL